jgi:hypothetical protein
MNSLLGVAQQRGYILPDSQPPQSELRDAHSDRLPPGRPLTLSPIQSPVLGLVYAADITELRTILGIPGASRLSGPLALPSGVTNVIFAPGQQCALVEQANGAPVSLIAFPAANPAPLVEIPNAIAHADMVAFSPSGDNAAVYSVSEQRLQVITGLLSTPRVAREIAFSALPDDVRLLAIADDGITLLEGAVNNDVYLLAEASAPRLVHSAEDLGGMAFTPGSHDLLVFDSSSGTLSLLQNVVSPPQLPSRPPAPDAVGFGVGAKDNAVLADNGNPGTPVSPPSTIPTSITIASGLTGFSGAVFLRANSHVATITSTAANELAEVNLQNRIVQRLRLPANAAALQPLRSPGKYLLSYQAGQPALIVDTSGTQASLYFIPAAR